jgi:hypothetical protein
METTEDNCTHPYVCFEIIITALPIGCSLNAHGIPLNVRMGIREDPREAVDLVHRDIPKKIAGSVTPHRNNDLRLNPLEFVKEFGFVSFEVFRPILVIASFEFSIQIGTKHTIKTRKTLVVEKST